MRIAIIGAGIVGLETAFELARADDSLDITVFDPAPASGTTYHAGGMLAPAAEVVYQQDPLFSLMMTSAAWYPELIDAVTRHTDLPTGYRTDGTLVVAADRADFDHLTALRAYQNLQGMTVEPIPASQARTLEPALTPRLAGAVSIPGDHQIAPRPFAAALEDAARRLGVTFVAEAVSEVIRDGQTGVVTASGTHAADQIVVANGLGASSVTGWHPDADGVRSPLQLRPVYGDILRVRVPDALYPLVTRVIRGFVEDRPIYVIPREDHTIAIGATTREDGRPEPRIGGVYDLLRDAIRVVPGIEECDLLEASTGARPGTPDDLPYLGRVGEHVVVSTGYFRHGILLSALGARCGCDLVLGRTPKIDLGACDPLRHHERN